MDGSATVTIAIKDNGGTANGGVDTSAPQTFTIGVSAVDDDPVLDPIGNRTVALGATLTFTATAADIDLPPQALTFSLTGTIPAGASINGTTGVFTWTPSSAQVGAIYTFSVRVTDSMGGFDAEQISVGVAYTTSGVLPPVENGGSTNRTYTAGQVQVDGGQRPHHQRSGETVRRQDHQWCGRSRDSATPWQREYRQLLPRRWRRVHLQLECQRICPGPLPVTHRYG